MSWHNLLFAHWPVSPEELRRVVPAALPLDTFDGKAWIGVVPFEMSGVRLRGIPGLPGTSLFPEINVRTYVIRDSKPGVYFFSLDAGSWLAVKAARAWYHLPYYHARITSQSLGEKYEYESTRLHEAEQGTAQFAGDYEPLGPVVRDLLTHWLTERYSLYTVTNGRTWMADIHHAPWPLHHARANIRVNSMTAPLGITLPDTTPLLHFAKRLDVVAWSPRLLH